MKNGWVLHRCGLHKPNATNILKEWLVYPSAEMVDTFIQDNPQKMGGSKTQHSIHSSVFHCVSFSRHLYHLYGKSMKGNILLHIFTSISLHHQKRQWKACQCVADKFPSKSWWICRTSSFKPSISQERLPKSLRTTVLVTWKHSPKASTFDFNSNQHILEISAWGSTRLAESIGNHFTTLGVINLEKQLANYIYIYISIWYIHLNKNSPSFLHPPPAFLSPPPLRK